MTYEIIFSKKAEKQFGKFLQSDRKRIFSTLERCRIRPHSYVKKLVSSPYFRLKVGKYRIILDINSGKLIIMVLEIGHRKNIYK